jgi:hypothetical protein
MFTWKRRFTEMRKSKGKVFFIDGDKLLTVPTEGVEYDKAQADDLTESHHRQMCDGDPFTLRVILDIWLPRGIKPYYHRVNFMKPALSA